MKPTISFLLVGFLLFASCSPEKQPVEREIRFNSNWKFLRADVPGGQATDLDDSGWRTLDLPHDYSIEDLPEKEGEDWTGPFSKESAGGTATGHVVGGTAWYRKHFIMDREDEGKIIKVLFDGVYMNADFWINGHHLGNHPYGYSAFAYDLTEYLNPAGQENILAVQVKNEGKNSRWYSGSGIYRDVNLIKLNPVHLDLWGVYITTPKISREKAVVKLEAKIVNTADEKEGYTLKSRILDPGGAVVATWESPVNSDDSESVISLVGELDAPVLWSDKDPAIYTAEIELFENNMPVDAMVEKFGIRSIEFSPEKGFLLNGESVLLKGGCLHHDNGPLGSAAFKAAEYRRVKTMKDNGFNAIRTSHNPPSAHFLDACDELGILVMDESFDHWQRPKNDQDYHLYFDDWWEKDLESMVLRDRNHPSIVIWSVGNEINERADSSGLVIFKTLREKVLSMDHTRPVTQAICHFWDHPGWEWDRTAPAFDQMDIHGYNYKWDKYESDHENYPERIIVGTESFPEEAFINWQLVEDHPYIIGDFVWTGMDYLGESGIGHTRLDNAPSAFLPEGTWFNAYCGDISILGYKKPQMYYRDVVWRNSDLEMLVHAPVPEGRREVVSMWGWPDEWKSWNWEGNEGKALRVAVYSRCDQVRLELNGEVIGSKSIRKVAVPNPEMEDLEEWQDLMDAQNQISLQKTKALSAYFYVPYQPGELVAVGLNDGKEVVRQSLKTAGMPAALKVVAENATVKASGDDLAYFNVEVVDTEGDLVPNAEVRVEFDIRGNCQLQAVANGNPTDMKSFQQPRVLTFRGKCQLIVRSCKEGDEIAVTATSEGLESGTATVKLME